MKALIKTYDGLVEVETKRDEGGLIIHAEYPILKRKKWQISHKRSGLNLGPCTAFSTLTKANKCFDYLLTLEDWTKEADKIGDNFKWLAEIVREAGAFIEAEK